MRSTFLGLSVAQTGLAAQRRALETAGHNVTNANTEGYSRQQVDLSAINGGAIGIHSGTFYQGNGVEIDGVSRVVDQFLINRVNDERASLGTATERQTTLGRMEAAFGEPGDQALAGALEQFWTGWDGVAISPEDEAARAALLQRGEAIAERFQVLTREFDLMTEDAIQRGEATAVDINSIATEIADLNLSITAAQEAGAPANDLLDQRDELVRRLSDHIGVRTRVNDIGQMQVTIGGATLVAAGRTSLVSLDTTVPGAAVMRISNSSIPLAVKGGTMEGILEGINTTIPDQQAALDAVAIQLRDVVNAQHVLGQDLDLNPGTNFFAATGARDFSLDPGVAGNPRAVAAAAAGEGRFSGNNAVAMAELSGLAGGPDDAYRAMIADLGVAAQTANNRQALQADLTDQVDAQRESVSGVSIDEEMTNLVAFQQSYQASARFMTAIDEMLERLINGTGQVGR